LRIGHFGQTILINFAYDLAVTTNAVIELIAFAAAEPTKYALNSFPMSFKF
jgi:hypothetical protein